MSEFDFGMVLTAPTFDRLAWWRSLSEEEREAEMRTTEKTHRYGGELSDEQKAKQVKRLGVRSRWFYASDEDWIVGLHHHGLTTWQITSRTKPRGWNTGAIRDVLKARGLEPKEHKSSAK